MPNDTLRQELEGVLRAAADSIATDRPNDTQRHRQLQNLKNAEIRLSADIHERTTTYLNELTAEQNAKLNARRAEIYEKPEYVRAQTAQKAHQQTFETFRQLNEGAYPKNVSPVLYVIPLILVGVAEWYVNYSTFASMFIPVFAIAGTILVAAVFAWASHMHGAYLKQISEILHPSVEYRNVLGRKIALIFATILLVAAFLTVVWLRYIVIADQLGIAPASDSTVFGGPSSMMIWSRVGPTIVLNILIWGLGTLYSWAVHEKVPRLRESYRALLQVNSKVDSILHPFSVEEKQIKAHYDREREKNKIAIKEYRGLLEDVKPLIQDIQRSKPDCDLLGIPVTLLFENSVSEYPVAPLHDVRKAIIGALARTAEGTR